MSSEDKSRSGSASTSSSKNSTSNHSAEVLLVSTKLIQPWAMVKQLVHKTLGPIKESEDQKANQTPITLSHGFLPIRTIETSKPIKNVQYVQNSSMFVSLDKDFVSLWKGGVKLQKIPVKPDPKTKKNPINGFIGLKKWVFSELYKIHIVANEGLQLVVMNQTFQTLSVLSIPKPILSLEYCVTTNTLICGEVGGIRIFSVIELSVPHSDMFTLKELRSITEDLEEEWVSCIYYCPLRDFLYAGCGSSVFVFEYSTGSRVDLYYDIHELSITCISAYEPSEYLVTGAKDGTIKVWNVRKSLLFDFHDHYNAITGLMQMESASGSEWGTLPLLISSSLDATIRVWNMESGQALYRLETHMPCLGIHFIKKNIFYHYTESAIQLWNVNRYQHTFSVLLSRPIYLKRFDSPTKPPRVLAALSDGSLRLLSPRTGIVLDKELTILHTEYDMKNELIYTLYTNGSIAVYDSNVNPFRITSLYTQTSGREYVGCICGADFNSYVIGSNLEMDKRLTNRNELLEDYVLFAGTDSGQIHQLILGENERQTFVVQAHTAKVTMLHYDSSACVLISGGLDHTIKVWNITMELCVANGIKATAVEGYCVRLTCITVLTTELLDCTPSTCHALSSKTMQLGLHCHGRLWLVSYASAQSIKPPLGEKSEEGKILKIVCNASGTLWAGSYNDSTVKVWDLDGKMIREIQFNGAVSSVCFANERGDLLVGLADVVNLVRIQDYMTAPVLRQMLLETYEDDKEDLPLAFDQDLDFWNYDKEKMEQSEAEKQNALKAKRLLTVELDLDQLLQLSSVRMMEAKQRRNRREFLEMEKDVYYSEKTSKAESIMRKLKGIPELVVEVIEQLDDCDPPGKDLEHIRSEAIARIQSSSSQVSISNSQRNSKLGFQPIVWGALKPKVPSSRESIRRKSKDISSPTPGSDAINTPRKSRKGRSSVFKTLLLEDSIESEEAEILVPTLELDINEMFRDELEASDDTSLDEISELDGTAELERLEGLDEFDSSDDNIGLSEIDEVKQARRNSYHRISSISNVDEAWIPVNDVAVEGLHKNLIEASAKEFEAVIQVQKESFERKKKELIDKAAELAKSKPAPAKIKYEIGMALPNSVALPALLGRTSPTPAPFIKEEVVVHKKKREIRHEVRELAPKEVVEVETPIPVKIVRRKIVPKENTLTLDKERPIIPIVSIVPEVNIAILEEPEIEQQVVLPMLPTIVVVEEPLEVALVPEQKIIKELIPIHHVNEVVPVVKKKVVAKSKPKKKSRPKTTPIIIEAKMPDLEDDYFPPDIAIKLKTVKDGPCEATKQLLRVHGLDESDSNNRAPVKARKMERSLRPATVEEEGLFLGFKPDNPDTVFNPMKFVKSSNTSLRDKPFSPAISQGRVYSNMSSTSVYDDRDTNMAKPLLYVLQNNKFSMKNDISIHTIFQMLLEQLKNNDIEKVIAAIKALESLYQLFKDDIAGTKTFDMFVCPMLDAYLSQHSSIRKQVVVSLVSMGLRHDNILTLLICALNEKDKAVIQAAIKGLANYGIADKEALKRGMIQLGIIQGKITYSSNERITNKVKREQEMKKISKQDGVTDWLEKGNPPPTPPESMNRSDSYFEHLAGPFFPPDSHDFDGKQREKVMIADSTQNRQNEQYWRDRFLEKDNTPVFEWDEPMAIKRVSISRSGPIINTNNISVPPVSRKKSSATIALAVTRIMTTGGVGRRGRLRPSTTMGLDLPNIPVRPRTSALFHL